METTATVKGQIVIPASIRKFFGIKAGTRLTIETDKTGHCIILKPITPEFIALLKGKYKGKKSALSFLMKERKKEKIS